MSVKQRFPAWQVVHISRSGHILDIKVLPAICQLPGVDVVDHGAEGGGVHLLDVDLPLSGLPHVGVQHGPEHWRSVAEKVPVDSERLGVTDDGLVSAGVALQVDVADRNEKINNSLILRFNGLRVSNQRNFQAGKNQ